MEIIENSEVWSRKQTNFLHVCPGKLPLKLTEILLMKFVISGWTVVVGMYVIHFVSNGCVVQLEFG